MEILEYLEIVTSLNLHKSPLSHCSKSNIFYFLPLPFLHSESKNILHSIPRKCQKQWNENITLHKIMIFENASYLCYL